MVSAMGDAEGNARGNFVILDSDFNVKGTWTGRENDSDYGYDFWYQPHHNVLISTQWGRPKNIFQVKILLSKGGLWLGTAWAQETFIFWY